MCPVASSHYAPWLRLEINDLIEKAYEAGFQNGISDGIAIGRSAAVFDSDIYNIQKVVSDHFGIERGEMSSRRRSRWLARPRQIAMSLSREMTPHSLPTIGRHFGNRDHTTVIHAIDQVAKLSAVNPAFAADVDAIRAALKG